MLVSVHSVSEKLAIWEYGSTKHHVFLILMYIHLGNRGAAGGGIEEGNNVNEEICGILPFLLSHWDNC